ncbi:FAD/NAD(P)-binding domain-containing protein [Auricularia subglabra TFB-10046 SS5]|nr:FAD/NAD(P)-binding domain-containing protein [Auricularia subglabra TFB-10046 SS5]
MSSLPAAADVVIVGAGPSGMACALGLAARNVPFVIVDALAEGRNGSRAVLMQANALEALEATNAQMVAEIVAGGVKSEVLSTVDLQERPLFKVHMHENAKRGTKYPFSLLIGQHDVERIMRSYLHRGGNDIHWNTRVAAVQEAGRRYELRLDSGATITARYVVAGDGSKSMIRSAAGIRFLDPGTGLDAVPLPRDPSFIVADVLFATPLPQNVPRDHLQMMIGPEGVVLTAPIINHAAPLGDPHAMNLFRLYLGVPGTPPSAPDAAYIQDILDRRGPGSHNPQFEVPKVQTVLTSSRYRTRPSIADSYVHRSPGGAYILLVGDAAHKHGPAGGQGMNLGMCDGCELAEAIEAHRAGSVGEKADDAAVFEAYSTRRTSVARQVIAMVENMTEVERGGTGIVQSLRLFALGLAFKVPFINRTIAWNLSGLCYRK